jgi:hypothetical protein
MEIPRVPFRSTVQKYSITNKSSRRGEAGENPYNVSFRVNRKKGAKVTWVIQYHKHVVDNMQVHDTSPYIRVIERIHTKRDCESTCTKSNKKSRVEKQRNLLLPAVKSQKNEKMLAAWVKTGRLSIESPCGPSAKLPKRIPAKTERLIVEVCISVNCHSCRSTTLLSRSKERRKIAWNRLQKHKPAAHRMRHWNVSFQVFLQIRSELVK